MHYYDACLSQEYRFDEILKGIDGIGIGKITITLLLWGSKVTLVTICK